MKLLEDLGLGFVLLVGMLALSGGSYALGNYDGWRRAFYGNLKDKCEYAGRGVWYEDQKTCLRCPKAECPECPAASCELPDAGGD